MRIMVYTAIFGGIGDTLRALPRFAAQGESGIEFRAYVDPATHRAWSGVHPTGWELAPPVWEHPTSPRLRARRHKLLSHVLFPEHDVTIWLDGCLTPKTHPADLVRRYLQSHDICVFKHMQRDCIYQEARACKRLNKDRPEVIDALVKRYRREGYPEHRGLGETTCVMRRHTEAVREFNLAWWEELRTNSIRDQLSFDYLCWRRGLDYATLDGRRTDCPHFHWRAHR